MSEINLSHSKWMKRAIFLASLGKNTTSPNPRVGAVIIDKNGKLIAEGFHYKAGMPHAEAMAFNNLKKDGLFLFDFWFGPAVIHQKPLVRKKTIFTENNTICRIAEPELLLDRNQVNVKYTYYDFDHSKRSFKITDELHQMRYFSVPELEFLASETGFKVLNYEEFLTGFEPSFETWGVSIILRKNG